VSVQGVVTLLQHPEQLAQLKADPSLVNNMVEELLRFHTASALATRRVAKVDVPLNGQVRMGTFHPFACSRIRLPGSLIEDVATFAHSTVVFQSVGSYWDTQGCENECLSKRTGEAHKQPLYSILSDGVDSTLLKSIQFNSTNCNLSNG
jgi:hypothetical protein